MMMIGFLAGSSQPMMSISSASRETNLATEQLWAVGFIMVNVGAPLWISANIVTRNNKKATDSSKRQIDLSFGVTGNGAGVSLSF